MKKNNTQIETVEYDDNIYHAPQDCSTTREKVDRAAEARDAIFDLLLAGKLDKTDIAIIEARNCSQMPSMRDVAAKVGIGLARVHERTERIMKLMPKDLQQEMKKKRNATPFF